MREQLERELAALTATMEAPWGGGRAVSRLAEHAWAVEGPGTKSPSGKRFGLTVLALVHGTEVAGAAVLAEFAAWLKDAAIPLRHPVALAIGNLPAARAGRRFVGRDLNRSFGRDGHGATWEEGRARELEPILDETAFLLDVHQTIEPSASPFFIFPYHAAGIAFAAAIDARVPIVTHWGKAFSADGRCTDEHVIARGGVGVTIELGQNGFHPYHVAMGFRAAVKALHAAEATLAGQAPAFSPEALSLHTWAEIIPYPAGDVRLREGFTNFMDVAAGQALADVDGGILRAKESGKVLFPKYVRDPAAPRPAELIRIMKAVPFSALGG